MRDDRFRATYLIETPLDPAKVAEVMAGEQSCGTFTRVEGETDALRERARAVVVSVEQRDEAGVPSLPNAWLTRREVPGPWHLARITLDFPVANVGANLPTLASVVAGNLFDLGEVTGLRLEAIELPAAYRRRFAMPAQGLAGTRRLAGVKDGVLVGSIIKPNVGLSAEDTAALVMRLCEAGLDFIKDDEISANPDHAPLAQRIPAVMAAVHRHRDRTGKNVMVAFNITDETDAMRRHADLVAREGGSCVMASLNWCGFSAIESLRRSTDLALHGHRNGYGALSRHPLLGIGFQAYQVLWRLAGVDHMHVHGLQGKFAQEDAEVVSSARDCMTRLAGEVDDRVMPAFSSGQWAGTVPATHAAIGHTDLLFMAGGGVMAHPGGPAAGVASIREAWDATMRGETLDAAARGHAALRQALDTFGAR
ncbi:ribulose-bisphosphate carboxylase large subunit family protein [Teichococcus vastitatis]|uniref:Ribulose-bisphosphate carboxylase large subunit family protein n=2 Tax=Teichococcus vastitatis TaxID=2307076 RepID=A0ABS9W7Y6_9PROT|nr:ribulose-bisphosphate carboxylase large subunit family protein [Pseudoroseomonas vastitatis]MCI0755412.1 ribulose-bisphosphate carboxylase large subunit family protein [Pseudoroseomonas vastitatis]